MGSNADDPVTKVRGTEGRSGYTVPDRIEPERGQVPENFSPYCPGSDSKEVCNVLNDDDSGS